MNAVDLLHFGLRYALREQSAQTVKLDDFHFLRHPLSAIVDVRYHQGQAVHNRREVFDQVVHEQFGHTVIQSVDRSAHYLKGEIGLTVISRAF